LIDSDCYCGCLKLNPTKMHQSLTVHSFPFLSSSSWLSTLFAIVHKCFTWSKSYPLCFFIVDFLHLSFLQCPLHWVNIVSQEFSFFIKVFSLICYKCMVDASNYPWNSLAVVELQGGVVESILQTYGECQQLSLEFTNYHWAIVRSSGIRSPGLLRLRDGYLSGLFLYSSLFYKVTQFIIKSFLAAHDSVFDTIV